MIHTTHYLSRIVRTAGTQLRYIFDDGYEETHDEDWEGWWRGVMGTATKEYYCGTPVPRGTATVLSCFLDANGIVEDYEPPEEE